MVNIFGGRGKTSGVKGERGPIGPSGKEGSAGSQGEQGEKGERGSSGLEDLCIWLPTFILQAFRNIESCCYFFPKDGSGFKKSGNDIVRLISHSSSPALLDKQVDATAIKACTNTKSISNDRLALQFDRNMLYKSEGVKLAYAGHAWVCLCITFRVRSAYDQWIVSSPPATGNKQFRAVTATTSSIRVWGKDHGDGPPFVHVSYPKGSWVTVFVEWNNIGDRLGSVDINNGQTHTTFTCEKLDASKVSNDVMIGANMIGETIEQGMNGDLAALEIYASDKDSKLPDYLKNIIMRDQMMTAEAVTENEEPPVKKKKKNQSDSSI